MKKSIRPGEISELLAKELASFHTDVQMEEVGTVLQIGDGVARIYGLGQVEVGEILLFPDGSQALALNLEEDNVGAVLLCSTHQISQGDLVKRTGRTASIMVGEGVIGRVVNTLGEPIDGKGPITGQLYAMPLERKAPGVIYRDPVKRPLQTGIKAIDTMIPIGRGQRELIIGDRQTGKTSVAIDAIISQRSFFEKGEPVYCIYAAIGQKASTVTQIVATLEAYGAMDYTTVVFSSAADPAPLQFIAPFSAVSIGEYFRDTGRDALVVYDDLYKQAVAYREISLLLKRPPGREAFPGDVFYLHARLLERAAQINSNDELAQSMNDLPPSLAGKVKGGGSLSALPIVETQGGDVSAYIPTNVISITDGQIFLDTDLFNADIRPAINVGISVSRVGGAAQVKAMKQLASSLKLGQAQFRELEAFAKFSSDLDSSTRQVITRGRKQQRLLMQPNLQPLPAEQQIALLYAAQDSLLDLLEEGDVSHFEKTYLDILMRDCPDVLAAIRNTGELSPASKGALDAAARQALSDKALHHDPLTS